LSKRRKNPRTKIKPLDSLIQELKEISRLGSIRSLLNWDQETYMPKGAIEARSEQIALMARLSHERIAGPALKRILGRVIHLKTEKIQGQTLSSREKRLVKEAYRDWKKARALPTLFVEDLARLTSQAQHFWQEARKNNCYSDFAPYLEKIIQMNKKRADYLGWKDSPYDALLQDFEPNLTTAQLIPVFEELKEGTVRLLQKIKSAQPIDSGNFKGKKFSIEKQWNFGLEILKEMGFDFNCGRQDQSVHPFSTSFHPSDARITTRLDEQEIGQALFGTMHEGGHALYEQGLDPRWYGTPLCEPISLGIHESQSRLWENYIGRSEPFWRGHFRRLQKFFPEELAHSDYKTFYRWINSVKPSPIRVEADEVTYNLHILIRFEIEKEMINGQIDVKELPEIWNSRYQQVLGLHPDSDAKGILQDIHWSMGAMGYFPTYTLGNLYGRMIFDQMSCEIKNMESIIENGPLTILRNWLREKIHRVGRGRSADELIQDISGKKISAKPFLRYLNQKFSSLYHFPVDE